MNVTRKGVSWKLLAICAAGAAWKLLDELLGDGKVSPFPAIAYFVAFLFLAGFSIFEFRRRKDGNGN
jgi:hypothetical protein